METPRETELCFPTLNNSCRRTPQPELQTIIIYILLSVIAILTVILNLLVIISIAHFRQLHTSTNFLLLSLAVSDFLVGSVQMPFQIFYYRGCWLLGDVPCVVCIFCAYIMVGVSCGNVVLISADRYLAICDPISYKTKVTVRRVQVCILGCWIYYVVISSCILRDSLKQPGIYNTCAGECVTMINQEDAIFDVLIGFVGPFTAITVLYMRVFVVAVSQARAIRSQITSHLHGALQRSGTMAKKSELKAAKTLGVVVLVYLLFTCPYYAYTFVMESGQIDPSSGNVEIWLIYFNSCINPVIYTLSYSWFRRSIKNILTLQILKPYSRDSKIL